MIRRFRVSYRSEIGWVIIDRQTDDVVLKARTRIKATEAARALNAEMQKVKESEHLWQQ